MAKKVTKKPTHKTLANPTFVVGIGASAGGVEALTLFFEQVSPDSGMAYVVILHLSPDYDSQLTQILQNVTTMPVTQVNESVRIEANQVYVVPPNQHLQMVDSMIVVQPNVRLEERRAPVDIFFRTLAESLGPLAIAVVLSGSGANGSMGLKRVKEKGGAAFVQNPREAAFNEMPRHAIATDLIDGILPVAQIPARLLAYRQSMGTVSIPEEAPQRAEDQQQALREVFTQLRLRTGHDFSNYKRSTLLRRLERRISIHSLASLPAYAAFLREHAEETQALLKDLLISVTNFFRDQSVFTHVEQQIIPQLTRPAPGKDGLRIWIAGCATGEEAYSLAMLCAEQTLGVIDAPKVQIFATDIDEDAIATAREGLYTLNDAADVSAERLSRFFTKEGDGYRIRREIRETILFAHHNVLKDPPFSQLDMVSCRNMLIYLNAIAQERVMETFHFALRPGGYLMLGQSETVDGSSDLYAVVSREYHLYQSRQVTVRSYPVPENFPKVPQLRKRSPESSPVPDGRPLPRLGFGELHQQLLEQYAPPSIIINEEYDILHVSERAGRYLLIGGGELTKNLLQLIRSELRLELRTALYQATQQQTNVDVHPISLPIEEKTETITMHVRPVVREGDPARGFILVLFESVYALADGLVPVRTSIEPMARQLEGELIRAKAHLRSANEQHELQAEELKASNEELQAMNEELRSAAEELETGKEEMQSINEELTTVNQELKIKVEEASLVSNNLQNLINSTDLATLFLDRTFQVKLFTPATRQLFNLIPSDIGRSLTDITNRLDYASLQTDAETVLFNLQPIEREVDATDGRVFIMRVLPYRTSEDRINGVVMTFVDITEHKRQQIALRASETRLAFLLQLSDALRPLSDAVAIQATATQTTMTYFGADRCYYCEIEGDNAIIRQDASRPDLPSVAGDYPLHNLPIIKVSITTGEPFIVYDVHSSEIVDEELRQLCIQLQVISFANVPLVKNGQVVGVLCTTQTVPRQWTAVDIKLAQEAAERTWTAVERAKSEAALRESEQQLANVRSLTLLGQTEDLARIGSWEYHRPTGQFHWSDGMYRLFGLGLGQPIEPTIYLERIVAEDRDKAQRLISYLHEGSGSLETDLRIRVGEDVKTLRIKADVIGKDNQHRVLGVDLDITDQLQAQHQIQETAENLQAVLNASPASIALLKAVRTGADPELITDFQVAVVNDKLALFFNQPLADLLGQSADLFGELLWNGTTLDVLREVYYSHNARYEEKPMPAPHQDRWLAISVMRQDDGVVFTGLDITELKQIQGQQQDWLSELETSRHNVDALGILRASLNQRTELLRAVSHDLRGNFGVITGGLQLLDLADTESDRAKMMAMVLRNVKQATGLLTDLLDLARLETGQQPRTIDSFDASALLQELGQSLQPVAQEQNLILHVSGPATLPIENDRQLVYRMAQNLIINALKYTHQGQVTVHWAKSGDQWWFEVTDTGPGLTPELVESINTAKLIEPSPSAEAKTTTNWVQLRGEGIGLRIVRELATLLGAQLQVRSDAGVGTRFRVRFPVHYA